MPISMWRPLSARSRAAAASAAAAAVAARPAVAACWIAWLSAIECTVIKFPRPHLARGSRVRRVPCQRLGLGSSVTAVVVRRQDQKEAAYVRGMRPAPDSVQQRPLGAWLSWEAAAPAVLCARRPRPPWPRVTWAGTKWWSQLHRAPHSTRTCRQLQLVSAETISGVWSALACLERRCVPAGTAT